VYQKTKLNVIADTINHNGALIRKRPCASSEILFASIHLSLSLSVIPLPQEICPLFQMANASANGVHIVALRISIRRRKKRRKKGNFG